MSPAFLCSQQIRPRHLGRLPPSFAENLFLCTRSSSASSKNFCNRMHYPSNFKRSAAPARRKAVVSVDIEGSTMLFDFVRMLQIDLGAGSQRSIAWIDVNGRPFFPKAFVNEDLVDRSDSPKVQINQRVNVSGRVLGKKRTEEEPADEDEVTSSIRPWSRSGRM
ncbi:hypothetical protein ACFX1T_019818 [Malus domestica]